MLASARFAAEDYIWALVIWEPLLYGKTWMSKGSSATEDNFDPNFLRNVALLWTIN